MRPKNLSGKRSGSLRINLIALLLAAIGGLLVYGYYTLSPSYNASRAAKALYDEGNYEEALKLASAIQADHPYNIMAFTVVEQSQKALRRQKFIDTAAGYWQRIETISRKKTLDPADLLTVRMMAEAVLYDYAKLEDPGILMDKRLIEEADYYHRQFTALYQELFNQPKPPVSNLPGAGARPR